MTGVPDLVELGLAERRGGLLTFGECGLYLDVSPGEAVAEGDWVATAAGSRYLVLFPADVVCWELRWYPRRRRQS